MKHEGGALHLSATDLAGHLGCQHLSQLDRLVALGKLKPPVWRDPMLDVLRARGLAHEQAYLEYLRTEQGLDVLELEDVGISEEGFERTRTAMREGVGAIAQGTLIDGRWRGRADVLLRTNRPSELGPWSYEVADTKLAAETRGGTVLQLCLYSDLLGGLQGALPEQMFVVSPGRYADPERFRTRDFLAFYRWVRGRLENAVEMGDEGSITYPEPVSHCDVCRWWTACDRRRRDDDHLSLVAGATRLQQRELASGGIDTLTRFAKASLPLNPRPKRGSDESYLRAHAQAKIQLVSRGEPRPRFEVLEPIEPGRGLARLPAPSPGDVFLDFEGDPFVEGGGREYLFGWVVLDEKGEPEYRSRWAPTAADERAAFEAFIDEVMARWERHPDLHVYHFAPYEPAALKRLMGRHGTREDELDRLLRAERFVDLHGAVRQGLRVGVERYSLKDLESLHDFERALDLREASAYLRGVERALELGDEDAIPDDARAAVEAYNRDDCLSTWSLRGWLEGVRADAVSSGTPIRRPEAGSGDPPEELDERTRRIQALFERLTRDVAADPESRSEDERARWLLAHLLEWHRREDKASWWEYFRLRGLSDDQLLDEKAGLSGLEFAGRFGGTDACPIHRYRFPAQDHDVRRGQTLHHATEGAGQEVGDVADIDPGSGSIDIKKRKASRELHPRAVFVHDNVRPGPLPDSLERLARWVSEHGLDAQGPFRAGRDLVSRNAPRLYPRPGDRLYHEGEELLAAARRLVLELDGGVLPVQGPPGAGKTYMGARMICELVRTGRKVGVTAVSHKVIRNLLEAVIEAAEEEGLDVQCLHKVKDRSDDAPEGIAETTTNPGLLNGLMNGDAQVGAGTVWAWARPEFEGAVDVLVVDEAGQMSLANTLAASQAARSLVLLGDPQQLEQPIQGSHPEGADVSALEHLLEGHETISDERGLFLSETWRLHPTICEFTSELFYEGRLGSRPGCEIQRLVGPTPFAGAGLWFAPVGHEGNQSSSPEEVDRVADLYASLLAGGATWVDPDGLEVPLSPADVLIVAPYNAQVGALSERLPEARVGTVDKFQGQEAPVVIYSMATSAPEDAPRGMEFLYSLHRLNVATSRARCVCIVVASPRLLEPDCRTPHQMRLANALCRFRELAKESM
ncbi:MAG: TM0106 family RecB-like putative nuclease [Acidimicrobiia bacterium]|nr:TM0106 family RecB-like putative nuclease [Acidimicrobiia bacterium]